MFFGRMPENEGDKYIIYSFDSLQRPLSEESQRLLAMGIMMASGQIESVANLKVNAKTWETQSALADAFRRDHMEVIPIRVSSDSIHNYLCISYSYTCPVIVTGPGRRHSMWCISHSLCL